MNGYSIELARAARRQLTEGLPEAVAAAVWEFINGPLRENPQRVGTELAAPYKGRYSARRGFYRIIYTINDTKLLIHVVTIEHRRNVYRT